MNIFADVQENAEPKAEQLGAVQNRECGQNERVGRGVFRQQTSHSSGEEW